MPLKLTPLAASQSSPAYSWSAEPVLGFKNPSACGVLVNSNLFLPVALIDLETVKVLYVLEMVSRDAVFKLFVRLVSESSCSLPVFAAFPKLTLSITTSEPSETY